MGNITYIKDFLDRRAKEVHDTNETDENDETESMRIIRENMKNWLTRQKKVEELIKEKNRRASPKG